LYRLISD